MTHRLTPVAIELLMAHHYKSMLEHQPSPAQIKAAGELIEAGILHKTGGGHITTTDKGVAFVEMICRTPYPVQDTSWLDPRRSK